MSNKFRKFEGSGAARPWYREPWPWLLMLGPVSVIVAGLHTAMLAYSKPDALVVDDYYKQGLAINQDLRRERLAESLKMDAQMHYDAKAGVLSGAVSSLGRPYAGKLKIGFMHSTLPDRDFSLQAQSDGQGHFSVSLPALDMARWQVRIEGEQSGWRLDGVWEWPARKEVALRAER